VIDRTGDEVKDPDVDTNEVSTAFQQSKEKKIGVVTVGDSADTAITVASETENENDEMTVFRNEGGHGVFDFIVGTIHCDVR